MHRSRAFCAIHGFLASITQLPALVAFITVIDSIMISHSLTELHAMTLHPQGEVLFQEELLSDRVHHQNLPVHHSIHVYFTNNFIEIGIYFAKYNRSMRTKRYEDVISFLRN